ncbi:MAG: tail fiber domain-containing protein [Pannonibacter phragmitetus]
MGKSAPSAPAPDPLIGAAALKQAETGEQWLSFSKDAFAASEARLAEIDALTKEVSRRQIGLAEDQAAFTKQTTAESMAMAREQQALAKTVTEKQLALADEQAGYARQDRERYNTVFKPVEDQFVKAASEYDSPEKQAEAAAAAKADVQGATAQQRAAAQREAASMGLNPNSGRFQGLNRSADLGTALASAGAQNNARKQVRDTGLALKADVANLGRGLPAQSSQAAALGLQSGASAAGISNAAAGLGINAGNAAIGNMGNAATLGMNAGGLGLSAAQANLGLANQSASGVNAGFSGAMNGYAGQANTLQNQYNSQLSAWQTQMQYSAQNASGIGSALGGLLGFAFMSDEKKKKDKKPVPKGKALDAVNDMPVEEWTYKEGVADEGRHVGPYAQDFQKATGRGDGKKIMAQDAIGITMKAVQDLDDKVDRIADAVGLGTSARKMKPAAKAKTNGKPRPKQQPIGLAA